MQRNVCIQFRKPIECLLLLNLAIQQDVSLTLTIKIFFKVIGDMFHRLEALEKQCVDIVKSGKISTHFPIIDFDNLGTVENENEHRLVLLYR